MVRISGVLLLAIAAMILLGGCGPLEGDQPPAEPSGVAEGLVLTMPPTMPPTSAPLPTVSPTEAATSTPVTAPTSTDSPSPLPTPAAALLPTPGAGGGSGNADVVYVRAVQAADDTWTFHVSVEHPDTGWEDYADGWDLLTPDGTVLRPDPDSPFTRLLLHPHVGEQPFTRSQSGLVVPAGLRVLRVRAHDLVDGYGGQEVLVDLTVAQGQGFEVERNQ